MSFTLSISSNNVTYNEIDLFENQDLFYESSFYDDVDIDKIKIPFYTTLSLPLTPANKSILGYDPLVDDIADFPTGDYYFKINVHNASNTQINGILNVTSLEYNSDAPFLSVDLKDFITVFLTDLNELGLGDVLTDSYYSNQHEFNDFLETTTLGGEAGEVGVAPDFTRPVNFPYVDLANDTQKFSYEARHFAEYGAGQTRTAFVPTLSVKNYLDEIGNYLSNANRPVEVRSKLFGLNDTVFNSDFEPEKLQAIIPAKLQAKSSVNTRQFQLTQAEKRAKPNEDLSVGTNLDGGNKRMRTIALGSGDSFGNYGLTGTSYQKYGIKAQNQYSLPRYNQDTESYDTELGYFCPHMSFNSRIQFLSGDRFEPTGTITYEIPTIQEDKMVYKIEKSTSTMKFGVFLGVYEDGFQKREIRFLDSNGDPLELDIANATLSRGITSKDQNSLASTDFLYADTGTPLARINTLTFPGIQDMLEWGTEDLYLPTDDSIDLEIFGESRYGISVFVKPVSGEIDIEYVDTFSATSVPVSGYNVHYAATMDSDTFEAEDVRKAITEIQSYSNLNILIKAIEDYNMYFLNDEYVIKDSLNNTTELSPVDMIKIIAKRFGCALMYEYDNGTHILRIDPLHILRDNTVSGDYFIDDTLSIKISKPTDIIKNLIVSNAEDGLYYDKFNISDEYSTGTINQVLNSNGLNDYKIELESGVFYKSLCGDEFYETNENIDLGIISTAEAGSTDNVFTPYNGFSVRFAYLTMPLYKTNLKVPYSLEETKRPNIKTTTQRIYVNMYDPVAQVELYKHTFNGRLSNVNGSGFNLLGQNKEGITTDYYDLISATEQITSKGKASVEMTVVFPITYLSSTSFMLDKYYFSLINNQNILIKSAQGQVFDDNAYLSIKGLIE